MSFKHLRHHEARINQTVQACGNTFDLLFIAAATGAGTQVVLGLRAKFPINRPITVTK